MKTHKPKRSKKMRGKGQGTHGWGFRKSHRKSGHKGGKGMAGSGKRADHKKTLVTKLYGNNYFGKQGITSKRTQRDKSLRLGLNLIEKNLENFVKKGIAKKTTKGFEIELKKYKILLGEKDYKIKNKLIIVARSASKTAIDAVKKSGGEIVIREVKTKNQKKEEKVNPKK